MAFSVQPAATSDPSVATTGDQPVAAPDQPPAVTREAFEPGSRSDTLRGFVRKLLPWSMLGILVFAGLSLYADTKSLSGSLRTYRWETFAFAILLSSANYLLRFLRWHFYLQRLKIEIGILQSTLVYLAGFAMTITPGRVGDLLKSVLLLERWQIPISRSVPVLVAERITDLVAMTLLAALGAGAYIGWWGPLAFGALLFGGTVAAASPRIGGRLSDLSERIPGVRRFSAPLRRMQTNLAVIGRPIPLIWGTMVAFAAWALQAWALLIIVSGFSSASIGPSSAAFSYAGSMLAGLLALLPGGVGVAEASMIGFLRLTEPSLDIATATSATILVRLATLWYAVLLGVVGLMIQRRSVPR